MAAPTAVLHLLNGEQYSGLERMVDQLAAAAPRFGFRLVLVLLKPATMRLRMSSGGAPVHELPMRSRFDLGVAHEAARIAAQARCALVHSHTVRSALIARRLRRLTGLAWVHHIHSPALHDSERHAMNLVNFLAEAVVMRHADRVLAVSPALAEYALRCYRIAPGKISVVPNGVPDVSPAAFATPRPQAVCRCFTVLAVGLFRPRKGIGHLVQAAAVLRDAGHHFRLRLAGEFADRHYEASIRRCVRHLGLASRVEFLGFIQEVGPVLTECDVFVQPSLYGEGMPMAVLEAMAVGRPIVASDIGGIRELLHGGAGLLVAPGSVQALAGAVGRLIAEPALRARLAEAARDRQRRFYSVLATQSRLFDLYRELLAPDPGLPASSDRPPTLLAQSSSTRMRS